ncbi:retrovirus-related pol polyprotein from transposon TNT 1-94 [Tanacetum coccineum]
MTTSNSLVNVSQPQIPVFKGDFYELWSIKMKTLFRSQDLWDLVDKGCADSTSEETTNKENQKRDAKAFFLEEILNLQSLKAMKLYKHILPESQALLVKLQFLRRDLVRIQFTPPPQGRGTAPKKTSATNAESVIGSFYRGIAPLPKKKKEKKEVWKKAMQEEINFIEKNGTWKPVNLPEKRQLVLEQGIDFVETFLPMARFETVRIILALAAHMRWTVFQFDVKSAFLNGELKKETKNGIFVSQEKYARDIPKQFNMEGCNTEETPMNVHEIDDGTGMADARKFSGTSNISHSHTTRLGICSWSIIKVYALSKKEKFELVGYCDSDWAGAKDDMKSTSGNCFMFGSGVVTWGSKNQATIALSSTEAEYISAATAACQAVWLRRVLEDLNQTQDDKNVQLLSLATTANPLAGEVSGAVTSTWRASTLDLRAQCLIAPCALKVQDAVRGLAFDGVRGGH